MYANVSKCSCDLTNITEILAQLLLIVVTVLQSQASSMCRLMGRILNFACVHIQVLEWNCVLLVLIGLNILKVHFSIYRFRLNLIPICFLVLASLPQLVVKLKVDIHWAQDDYPFSMSSSRVRVYSNSLVVDRQFTWNFCSLERGRGRLLALFFLFSYIVC